MGTFVGNEESLLAYRTSFSQTAPSRNPSPTPFPTPFPVPVFVPTPFPTGFPSKFPTGFPSRFPTKSPTLSVTDCDSYTLGPPLNTNSTLITDANKLAKLGDESTVTVEGVVVNDLTESSTNGFFLQGITSHLPNVPFESELLDSHGIFVSCGEIGCSGDPPSEGDFVRVIGDLDLVLENPQLVFPDIEVINASTPSLLPNCPDLAFAVHIVSFGLPMFSPKSLKSYRGMLVHITHALVIGDLFKFKTGRIGLSRQRLKAPTSVVPPGSPEFLQAESLIERSVLKLDDGKEDFCPFPQLYFDPVNALRANSRLVIDATAVLDFDSNFQEFVLIPNEVGKRVIPSSILNTNPRETTLTPVFFDEVRIGTFNVFNYFTTFGCERCRGADTPEEYERQSKKLYAAIKEMDASILAIQEVQNFGGEVLEQLVSELNNFIGVEGAYNFIATGNIGNDAIKNGILYKPTDVFPIGNFAILEFVDPVEKSRSAIAQTFKRSSSFGQSFTIISNHLKSKGSPCPEDESGIGVLAGEGSCGLTREKHVQQLMDWINTDPTDSGNSNVMIAGDFNAYKEERAMKKLTNAGFVNLAERDTNSDLYTISFNGLFGSLDYLMASPSMALGCLDTKQWHINSDETNLIDYNDEQAFDPEECLTKPESYFDLSPFRSSDHDPIVTQCLAVVSTTAFPTEFPTAFPTGDGVDSDSSGGTNGAIAGAAIGVFAVIIVLGGALGLYVWSANNKKKNHQMPAEEAKKPTEGEASGQYEVYRPPEEEKEKAVTL